VNWGCGSVVDHLLIMHKVLDLAPQKNEISVVKQLRTVVSVLYLYVGFYYFIGSIELVTD
jgi:hypothetical protein